MQLLFSMHHSVKYPYIILLLLVFTISPSCQKSESDIYPYITGFYQYMLKQHGVDIREVKDKVFIAVAAEGCEPCIEGAMSFLLQKNIRTDIQPIIIGQPHTAKALSLVQAVQKQYVTLTDSSGLIGGYSTGFSYPIMIHIKNGRAEKYINVTAKALNEFQKYLSY